MSYSDSSVASPSFALNALNASLRERRGDLQLVVGSVLNADGRRGLSSTSTEASPPPSAHLVQDLPTQKKSAAQPKEPPAPSTNLGRHDHQAGSAGQQPQQGAERRARHQRRMGRRAHNDRAARRSPRRQLWSSYLHQGGRCRPPAS